MVLVSMVSVDAAPVRADDGECISKQCPAGSPREFEQISCDTPTCYCYNTCGSSGGGAAGGGRNTNTAPVGGMLDAMAKGIAYATVFVIMPALLIEWSMNGSVVAKDRKAAKKAWRRHRENMAKMNRLGKELRGLELKLQAEEALTTLSEERPMANLPDAFEWEAVDDQAWDDMSDLKDALFFLWAFNPTAPGQAVPPAQPVQPGQNPPPAQPVANARPAWRPQAQWRMSDFQCDMTLTTRPLTAGFTDWAHVQRVCGPMLEAPGQVVEQPGPDDLNCRIAVDNAQVFCFPGFPVYNPCSHQCFRHTDFRAAGNAPAGPECKTSYQCRKD